MSRLTIVAFVLAAACGGNKPQPTTTPLPEDKPAETVAKPEEKPPEPPPPPGPIEESIDAAPVEVKVTKAGTGKKSKLVYTAGKGEKAPVELSFDFVQKADSPDEKVEVISPTIILLADAQTSAPDETHVGFNYSLTGIDARDVQGSKMDAATVKSQLGALTGLTISGTVGSNGVASDKTAIKIEKGDEAGKQVVGLVKQTLPTWPVLPTEAIGAGAKWTATTTTVLMGQLPVTQVTEYELVSRKGTTAVVKGKIKISAPDVAQATIKISGIKGTGTTEATLTDGALPAFKTATDTSFTITDTTKNQSGTVGVKVATAVGPKSAAPAAAPATTPAPAAAPAPAPAPAKK